MKYTIIIVEDEIAVGLELQRMLEKLDEQLDIQAVCTNGETALAQIMTHRPDIIFLDIELPYINGLEIARTLTQTEGYKPVIVFLTAYDQFAAEAFDVDAVDYILKPVDENKVRRVLKRCYWMLRAEVMMGTVSSGETETSMRRLAVDKGDTMEVIDCLNIRFIYSKSHYAYISMKNGDRHEVRMSLRDIAQQLPHDKFFRCHRNYIVNVEEIKQIKMWFKRGYLLVLKGDEEMEIPVGRAYIETLKEYIKM